MRTLIAQELVTIRGGAAAGIITQSQHAWLELPDYPNAVAWLDVREVTVPTGATVSMTYQTAPTADDGDFTSLAGPLSTNALPFTPMVGVMVTPLIRDLLSVPLSRWFRWQLTASGSFASPWDVTFRLFVAAH